MISSNPQKLTRSRSNQIKESDVDKSHHSCIINWQLASRFLRLLAGGKPQLAQYFFY
jgi:hypothetical protein